MTTQNNPHKFTLGQRVRCTVTGFEGIATVRVDHLNGCVQYLVKPRCLTKDDEQQKMPDGNYIDDVQLDLVDQGILEPPTVHELQEILDEPDKAGTGGPSYREGELPT
jgi:hypothetical protein